MTGKITAILAAAALVLASAGVASAQPGRHARWQAPYADFYYNGDYWAGNSRSRPIKRRVLTRMPGRSFRVLLRTDGTTSLLPLNQRRKPRPAHPEAGRGCATLKTLSAEYLFCR